MGWLGRARHRLRTDRLLLLHFHPFLRAAEYLHGKRLPKLEGGPRGEARFGGLWKLGRHREGSTPSGIQRVARRGLLPRHKSTAPQVQGCRGGVPEREGAEEGGVTLRAQGGGARSRACGRQSQGK